MIELHDANHRMMFRFSSDLWALFGSVYGHPRFEDGHLVFTSCPSKFDPDSGELITQSGSHYKIVSYGDDKEKTIAQIQKDIVEGYEVH